MRWQARFEREQRPSILISYLCNIINYFQTAYVSGVGGKIMYSPLLFIIGGPSPPCPRWYVNLRIWWWLFPNGARCCIPLTMSSSTVNIRSKRLGVWSPLKCVDSSTCWKRKASQAVTRKIDALWFISPGGTSSPVYFWIVKNSGKATRS